ncbi:hypothetical protein Y032_0107g3793 [Ancylostoma ceylanicum]|uniref:Uncharacterized protein n=2 Tax=Ancylostoma ceylanicum TaxID=53326 RepID=A0A016TFJ2_9BILA|nr:hypothetical protein Y032_0107g3793 [Ancylostoma ceylanicum]
MIYCLITKKKRGQRLLMSMHHFAFGPDFQVFLRKVFERNRGKKLVTVERWDQDSHRSHLLRIVKRLTAHAHGRRFDRSRGQPSHQSLRGRAYTHSTPLRCSDEVESVAGLKGLINADHFILYPSFDLIIIV